MGYSQVLVISALAVVIVAVLPSLMVVAEAKFEFNTLDIAANKKDVFFTVGQDPHSVPPPFVKPGGHPPSVGAHPPGVGSHPPGFGHRNGKGGHPPNVYGVIPGHHPDVGHHPDKGHHPTKGHHCNKRPGLCTSAAYLYRMTPTCCSKSCVNILNDTLHCGACPTICPIGNVCCTGSCTDTLTNNTNCGACGIVCGPGTTCQLGLCSYGGV